MKQLNTFQQRLDYGGEAERAFEEFLKFAKIPFVKFINESYWTKEFDLINGDYLVMNQKIDVKRNSISFRSLDNFKGKYYVVYHHGLYAPLVLEVNEIKKLNRNECDELASGSKGYKYDRLKNLKYMTFDEFFKTN